MKRIRAWFIAYLTRNLLKAVVIEDLITTERGIIKVGKRVISVEEREQLLKEIEMFENSYLWKYMNNDIRFAASEFLFNKARVYDDMLFGKAMLYSLSVLEQFIENIRVVR